MPVQTAQCVIVGGGPAGLLAGALLARRGIDVLVVEKHPDFLRDFRGDTIHPSTLELMHELGWAEELLRLPHARMSEVATRIGGTTITFADFSTLKVHYPFIAFMPQWDFLDFIAAKANELPSFRLARSTVMTDLIFEDHTCRGIIANSDNRRVEVRADVVIAADGRHSIARTRAGLHTIAKSSPLDVLWLRLPRRRGDNVPFFQGGRGALVSIDRGDYWQLAYAVPANTFSLVQQAGLADLRERIAALAPDLADRVVAIGSWDDVHQLSVRVDRLSRWYRPGLLCIGDAAHAMSPAGGVGINLAIQDAVATANILGPVWATATPTEADLRKVQHRREFPTRVTQAFQTNILRDLYPKDLSDDTATHIPPIFRLFRAVPALQRVAGRFIGLGVRPEHLRS